MPKRSFTRINTMGRCYVVPPGQCIDQAIWTVLAYGEYDSIVYGSRTFLVGPQFTFDQLFLEYLVACIPSSWQKAIKEGSEFP